MANNIPNLVHRLDLGNERHKNLINNSDEITPRLPIVHSTDAYTLGTIVEDKNIIPQDCSVFSGERLTYLFYARPAYRPEISEKSTCLKHLAPICLIFKVDFAVKIKRIFPFDSGAFILNYYAAFLHEKMKLGDFGLSPDPSTPGRLVKFFFGSNENYMSGKDTTEPDHDPSEFEATSYHALISAKGSNIIDDRSSAIEIQTADAINLESAIRAVIMPSTFADSKIGVKLSSLGIDLLPYNSFERLRPNELTGKIYEMCRAFYISQNLIDESKL